LNYLITYASLSPIRRMLAPCLVISKKGALYSQPQVIEPTSCLAMFCGSLSVLRLVPPLKPVVKI